MAIDRNKKIGISQVRYLSAVAPEPALPSDVISSVLRILLQDPDMPVHEIMDRTEGRCDKDTLHRMESMGLVFVSCQNGDPWDRTGWKYDLTKLGRCKAADLANTVIKLGFLPEPF
ncbi:MAG: hypothetical protein LRZ85_06820 [Alphaproteobacteria bacterium]|nr:hypothetical protein [Alphaproteobacteria bacterium]MCD8526437.1 hypothetical protein [Alphaproteobacteria bacterium]MCD8571512.1 hypothetical protein [Alphaproteobacteria bacterium]